MPLRVLAPPGHTNLCTLQQVKDRLGLTGSSEDAKLSSLITAGSRAIATRFGRELARARYEYTAPGTRRLRLLLPVFPVDRDSVTVEIDEIADTDFTVEDAAQGILYREGGWWTDKPSPTEDAEAAVAATFKAGWVLPDDLATWTAAGTVTLGKWIQAPSTNPQPYLFEATVAGGLGATEPTWPTTAGTSVAISGGATLTARDAVALPADLVEAAILLVSAWRSGAASVAPNVASERMTAQEITYFDPSAGRASAFPRSVEALLEPWL